LIASLRCFAVIGTRVDDEVCEAVQRRAKKNHLRKAASPASGADDAVSIKDAMPL